MGRKRVSFISRHIAYATRTDDEHESLIPPSVSSQGSISPSQPSISASFSTEQISSVQESDVPVQLQPERLMTHKFMGGGLGASKGGKNWSIAVEAGIGISTTPFVSDRFVDRLLMAKLEFGGHIPPDSRWYFFTRINRNHLGVESQRGWTTKRYPYHQDTIVYRVRDFNIKKPFDLQTEEDGVRAFQRWYARSAFALSVRKDNHKGAPMTALLGLLTSKNTDTTTFATLNLGIFQEASPKKNIWLNTPINVKKAFKKVKNWLKKTTPKDTSVILSKKIVLSDDPSVWGQPEIRDFRQASTMSMTRKVSVSPTQLVSSNQSYPKPQSIQTIITTGGPIVIVVALAFGWRRVLEWWKSRPFEIKETSSNSDADEEPP